MRYTYIFLGLLAAIIALALSILPFGLIALIPAIIGLILGYLASKASKQQGKSKLPASLIFLLSIIALVITSYRTVFTENKVETDTEFIEKEKESKEEALEELEELETIDGDSVQ
ncbi:MAG: FUSC family protein [Flavobacteriaceae bacterium]|nr:FUSC family protein [Bacteroidia bacterium]NNK28986.1 FUSC family protein [Flavobacteriaceae bacterium]NNL61222.1 FUSC family protein [Flavobacteriaceae bacterium]RZV65785.1 MAG: FUSC family protein [Flavobacteriaceae bacterium]